MSEEKVECHAKHTVYQIPDGDFRCPKCGVDPNGELKNGKKPESGHEGRGFYVDEPCEDASSRCDKLHDEDYVCCWSCGYGATGKAFARLMMKRANRIVCPCCAGEGTVPGEVKKAKRGKKK